MITLDELRAICPASGVARLQPCVDPLNAAMTEFEINNVLRETMFLAQIAQESGGFHYVREIASGEAYEGRVDLGNTVAGDGPTYRGRSWMMITGRKNTGLCSTALYGYPSKLLTNPEILEQIPDCARASSWFWTAGAGLNLSARAIAHGIKPGCNLNDLADLDDFLGTTLAINGGTNGYQDRLAYLERAKDVLA